MSKGKLEKFAEVSAFEKTLELTDFQDVHSPSQEDTGIKWQGKSQIFDAFPFSSHAFRSESE